MPARCAFRRRFYVHEKIYNTFVEGFAARAKALPVGDGIEEKHKMGPLVHARRLAAIEALVDDARKSGAKLQAGGTRLQSPGYFYAPTVLSDVPNTARIMNEEPFGPVAVINSFSDYDAAIQQANRLPYGLAAFAFTNSAHRAKLVGEQLEAGMVGVNTFAISVPESPFGGVKESGHGSEEGIEGLEACLVTKFISEA
jgi:succinate-semialdehyde dehydrogenase / glutarate-semialdehyde dehydrogenase